LFFRGGLIGGSLLLRFATTGFTRNVNSEFGDIEKAATSLSDFL
jgi:hypothetical protein